MVHDRVIFEEKLKRGLVPDGDGGWITIEAAILKEKSRHRQSRLWDPGTIVSKEETDKKVESVENLFFEKSETEKAESDEIIAQEIHNSDPVKDTAEVDLFEEEEDTAVHEIAKKAPETTILERVTEPDSLLSANETDTVELDRDDLMRDVNTFDENVSNLDGLAEDFGDIIDSFAAIETNKNIDNVGEDTTLHIEIEEPSEIQPVKISDAEIDLPPIKNDSNELVLDMSENFASPTVNKAIANDSIDDWEKSNSSFWPKILIPAVLILSAAVLVATILIVT